MYEVVYIETLTNILNQVVLKKDYDVIFEKSDNLEQTFTINKTLFDILYIEYTDTNGVRYSQTLDDFNPSSGEYSKVLGDFLVGITFGETSADHKLFIAKLIEE